MNLRTKKEMDNYKALPNSDICDYVTSIRLKKLEFDDACNHFYNKGEHKEVYTMLLVRNSTLGKHYHAAPTWDQANRFLTGKLGYNRIIIELLDSKKYFYLQTLVMVAVKMYLKNIKYENFNYL